MFVLALLLSISLGCGQSEPMDNTTDTDIKGFTLLNDLMGHWIGENETAFGKFDWFAFDFRPISGSHLHSIYEGATNQNIITSVFIADYQGKQQIMARNGGWLGPQYRATYFLLDQYEQTDQSTYYRLVDAVGGVKRSYMEFRFEKDTLHFDAYKDNSGSLDEPIHHMGFKGVNQNPNFADAARERFSFPTTDSEVNFRSSFSNLIDLDSALYLEESDDPFPKSQHGHLSDLTINVQRDMAIENQNLLLYISKKAIVNPQGVVDFESLNTQVIRTITLTSTEDFYKTTYLHPDEYYITVFRDADSNYFPSSGDYTSISKLHTVTPETDGSVDVVVDFLIP